MVLVHLFLGVLVGFIAGVWGWMAGLPIWAVLCLYVLGGNLGMGTSAAVMLLRYRRAAAARTAEAAVRVAVVAHQQTAARQAPSGG